METEQAKQLITDSKNIYVIPSENDSGESIASSLALFYTLKELNKNVNLLIQDFPQKLSFLIPSLDFISFPKNLVISIPNNIADVSQIYYEKGGENLKIHLTVDKGTIKKENVSFYFSDLHPDLIITLGIKDFRSQLLTEKLNSYGFLLDSPIINIDSLTPLNSDKTENTNFGRINLTDKKSISQTTLDLIKSVDEKFINKNTSLCLLTGLNLFTDNFRNNITAEIFEIASGLMKKGADLTEINKKIF